MTVKAMTVEPVPVETAVEAAMKTAMPAVPRSCMAGRRQQKKRRGDERDQNSSHGHHRRR